MTTAPTPPRADALACEYRPSMPADVLHLWAKDAVAELIRLQSENERISPDRAIRMQQNDRMAERIAELEAQLVAEAHATAEHKLRADQLAQQHRMQAQMHAQATQQLAGMEANKNARIHKLEMDALDLASENSILKRQDSELEARKPLPLSYRAGAMTSGVDGGATVSLHFNDVAEAEAWFVGITDQHDAALASKATGPLPDITGGSS